MKFNASFFVLAAALALALPQKRQQDDTAGSLYFLNNNVTDNQLIIHDILSDGSIRFVGSVSTGGKGAHGLLDPPANKDDALFSQGPVRIDGTRLYAVNPGSDTISMFEIDPRNPSAPTLINTIYSGGNWPVSIAVHPKTGAVCALNGGASNGIACFNVDSKQGLISMTDSMRPIGIRQTTPGTGVAGTVSDLQFTEDGNWLVAAVKGIPGANMTDAPQEQGFLAVWQVGELDPCNNLDAFSLGLQYNKITLPTGSLLPFSLTPVQGKNAFVGSDAAVGGVIFQVNDDGSVNGSTIPIPGQGANCWSAWSPKTGNYYLADTNIAVLNEISVDDNLQGALVKQYPLANGSRILDDVIATVNGRDFLYVLAPTFNEIYIFSLDAPGAANNTLNFDYGTPAAAANIDVTQYNVVGLIAYMKSD